MVNMLSVRGFDAVLDATGTSFSAALSELATAHYQLLSCNTLLFGVFNNQAFARQVGAVVPNGVIDAPDEVILPAPRAGERPSPARLRCVHCPCPGQPHA